MNKDEYTFLIIVLSTSIISAFAHWAKSSYFKYFSERMARNMRYDLFSNYQAKCRDIPKDKAIDIEESKK